MSPTSFPTITSGEAWDTGPGQASTLMNQITAAINALEAASGSSVPTNYLAPTGASYETFPRQMAQGGALPLTSGTLYLVAIGLPTGFPVGHLAWASTRTLAVPTHYWFTLHDSSRVMLAATADQTSTAWAAGSKSLAVATIASGAASSFTTTYSGLYYLGIMVAAATTAQLEAVMFSATLSGLTPPISGATTTTGQTTVPAFPFTPSAPTAASGSFGYGYVGA